MATVFRLADVTQADTLDLLAGVIRLQEYGWRTQTTSDPGVFELITEVLRLMGRDTVANLTDAIVELEAMLERMRLFHDDLSNRDSIWLECNADGESARRVLLYGGKLDYQAKNSADPLLGYGVLDVNMAIERHPLWETTALVEPGTTEDVSCLGGQVTIDNVVGDAPARLVIADFSGVNGGGGPIYRLWAGIRPKYEGKSNFKSLWEAEWTPVLGTGASVDNTSEPNTSSPGSGSGEFVQVVFSGDATLIRRMGMSVFDVCDFYGNASFDHFMGRYLILARCKVNAGTIGMQLRYGYAGNAEMIQNEEVYVEHTDWMLTELGEVQFPPQGSAYGHGGQTRNLAIQLWAEHVSGTASTDELYVDCFILIPSRHFVYVEEADIEYDGGDKQPVRVSVFENDQAWATSYSSSYPNVGTDFTIRNWVLPRGDNVLVVAGEREAIQNIGDILDIYVTYYPRWRSFRNDTLT